MGSAQNIFQQYAAMLPIPKSPPRRCQYYNPRIFRTRRKDENARHDAKRDIHLPEAKSAETGEPSSGEAADVG
jgi:hypothetical protein